MKYVPYNYVYSIILVGESGVGKTTFSTTLISEKCVDTHICTVGIDFIPILTEINDEIKIKTHLWDTAGQEYFFSIVKSYFRDVVGAIIIYDVSNRKTFERVSKWLTDTISFSPQPIYIALIGNKTDLEREVSEEEGKDFAQKNNLLFFETSMKEKIEMRNMFSSFISHIYNMIGDKKHPGIKTYNIPENQLLYLEKDKPQPAINCCTFM